MHRRTHPRFVVLLLCVASSALFAACGGDDEPEKGKGASKPGPCARVEAPPVKETEFKRAASVIKKGEPGSVRFTTSCGSFTVELATGKAPKTANSFAFLARRGFFDETVFHRIAPNFVVQGGDPGGSGPDAGTGGPGYQVTEEPPESTAYTRGLVAMAKGPNEPPGTSGSQFFVVTGADAGLPPEYALVGRVTSGLRVVDAIDRLGGAGPTGEGPSRTVLIKKATFTTGGGRGQG